MSRTRRLRRSHALGVLALVVMPGSTHAQTNPVSAVGSEPLLQIGGALDGSPEHSFTDIASIAVIGDSILVLDASANEIRIFDHEGALLGRIGGPGEGPGEFDWATQLLVTPEGISVVDLNLRRQSYFSFDGDLLATEPLGGLSAQPLAGSAAMRGGFVIAETVVSASSVTGAFPERLIVLDHPGSQPVDTLARYSTGYVPFRLPDSFGFLSVRTGAEGDWAVAGDSLFAVVSGEEPVLRWWDATAAEPVLVGRLALPIQPESFTRGDTRRIVEQENTWRGGEGHPPLPRTAQVSTPERWGQVRGLVISDDHQCWIQGDRPRVDDYDAWFRIDLGSRRLERVTLPTGFRLLAVSGNRVYGYVLTEFDIPVVMVYALLK